MANTNLVGMKYLDMPEEYRNEFSKAQFKDARRDQKKEMLGDALDGPAVDRFAGDKVFEIIGKEDFKNDDRAKLAGKIERMESRLDAGKEIDMDKLAERQAKLERFDQRAAAQEEFANTGVYNFGSQGAKANNADLGDVEYLASRGYSANEIEELAKAQGATIGGNAQKLLNKYKKAIIEPDPVTPEPPTPNPGIDIEAPVAGTTTGDLSPVVGGGAHVADAFNNNIISNPAIHGDTGDIMLGDGAMNFGTQNTGIMVDNRNFGGGYPRGELNTGPAQGYVELMEDNWKKYSGPGYGAKITNMRTHLADNNNPINTAGLYNSLGMMSQGMYDKGLIQKAMMYGDPYKMPSASYPEFPQLGA